MVRTASRRRPTSRWKLGALAVIATGFLIWRIEDARQPGSWQRVLATREGQIGDITATRMRIRADSRFVALPDPAALGRMVEVRHGDRVVIAKVLDVGPWNIDDPYWEHDARPASERGRGAYRTPVNKAGIDLSDPVFAELGMRDNDIVEWRFVHRDFTVLPRL
ncbi:MAG TPA: hypothetical protein VFQ65_29735 [Kofleriaceae bacterium]|nr:hypothetical protein [Kofleriaceae bacterium]